jgi:hypothetical protein
MTDLQRLLADELDHEDTPSLDGVVERSLHDGRRMRRTRGLRLAAGATGAAALVVAAVVAGSTLIGPTASSSVPDTGGYGASPEAPSSDSSPPSDVDAQRDARKNPPPPGAPPAEKWTPAAGWTPPTQGAAGPRVPATPAGLLELIGRLLPAGETSHHAVSSDDDRFVQVYLDRGQGPAMIRFSVAKAQSPAEMACPAFASCTDVGRDRVELMEIEQNCIQRWTVVLRRADGVVISLNLASCLTWNGTANPPAPKALTTDEAVRIAFDPRWGTSLPRDVVEAGQRNFPQVPPMDGGS